MAQKFIEGDNGTWNICIWLLAQNSKHSFFFYFIFKREIEFEAKMILSHLNIFERKKHVIFRRENKRKMHSSSFQPSHNLTIPPVIKTSEPRTCTRKPRPMKLIYTTGIYTTDIYKKTKYINNLEKLRILSVYDELFIK